MIVVRRSTRSSRRHAALLLALAIGAGAVPSLRAIPAIHAAGLVLIGASAAVLLSRAARAPSPNDGPPDGFGACVPLIIVAVLLGAACWSGLFVPPVGDMTPVFAATGVSCVVISLVAIRPRSRERRGLWSLDDAATVNPTLLATGVGASGEPFDLGDTHSTCDGDGGHGDGGDGGCGGGCASGD